MFRACHGVVRVNTRWPDASVGKSTDNLVHARAAILYVPALHLLFSDENPIVPWALSFFLAKSNHRGGVLNVTGTFIFIVDLTLCPGRSRYFDLFDTPRGVLSDFYGKY